MKQLSFEGFKEKRKRDRRGYGIVLGERDLDVIEFVLDMKFASIEDVFERFFRVTLDGKEAKNSEWATRRLQQLTKAGYLKGMYAFSEKVKLYLGTVKGYVLISERRVERVVTKPVGAIDHRTFVHDRCVLESRIALENMKAATSWVSDRKLRLNSELAGGLVHGNVPDGIFVDERGRRVAFEMEMSAKSKADYGKKIQKYVAMMRSENKELKVFDRVLYVCAKEYAYKHLVKETKIYGELFEVLSFSEFFGRYPSSERG